MPAYMSMDGMLGEVRDVGKRQTMDGSGNREEQSGEELQRAGSAPDLNQERGRLH